MAENMKWESSIDDIEFDRPGSDMESFFLANDRTAGWAMRQIAKNNAHAERMLSEIAERIESYTASMQAMAEDVRAENERKNRQYIDALAVYFNALPKEALHATKAGRVSYDLPEGKIMLTAPKREYRHDDAKLLDVLKEHDMQEYIRRKETPDWAAIKKSIMVDASGNVSVVNLMGEIIETDAIVAVDLPGEFRVEVK